MDRKTGDALSGVATVYTLVAVCRCCSTCRCFTHLNCHVICSVALCSQKRPVYKALQLINFYLQQVYTNVLSSDMPPRNPVRPPTSVTFCDHSSSPCPTANAVPDPRYALCAVRYAPGGRGHAITNWQCISHLAIRQANGNLKVYHVPHCGQHNAYMHVQNSKKNCFDNGE